jgi:hypothetical protein
MMFHRCRAAVWLALVVSVVAASCSSTPEGPTIEITDTSWTATPVSVEAGGGSFSITVVNSGTEQEEFAVVSLFGGDPATLPMVDGLLDLSRDGLFADAENAEVATFRVVYPDYERREGEGVPPGVLTPDMVAPGEETTVKVGGFEGGGEPGTYVVLSWKPGGYEEGDYTSFAVTGP